MNYKKGLLVFILCLTMVFALSFAYAEGRVSNVTGKGNLMGSQYFDLDIESYVSTTINYGTNGANKAVFYPDGTATWLGTSDCTWAVESDGTYVVNGSNVHSLKFYITGEGKIGFPSMNKVFDDTVITRGEKFKELDFSDCDYIRIDYTKVKGIKLYPDKTVKLDSGYTGTWQLKNNIYTFLVSNKDNAKMTLSFCITENNKLYTPTSKNLYSDTQITKGLSTVSFKIGEPVLGKNPYNVTYKSTGIKSTSTWWYENGTQVTSYSSTPFKVGETYKVLVKFDLLSGYETDAKTAKLNDKTVNITKIDGQFKYQIEYTFPVIKEENTLKEVRVYVNEPKVGNLPDTKGSTNTAEYVVNRLTWSPDVKNYEVGKKYTVDIYVDIDEFDGVFDKDAKVYVNDKEATLQSGGGTKQISILYTFDELKIEEPTYLIKMAVEMDVPKAGKPLPTKATAKSEGFDIVKVVWNTGDETVVEGKAYTVKIYVAVKDGYTLRSDYFGLVNDNQAIVPVEYDKDNFYIEYTFYKDVWSKASDWAKEELYDALEKNLIPDILKNKDFTKKVTRQQFAHIAVKMYEKLIGRGAIAIAVNPFTDTDDEVILKAYNIGITNGISETEFAPDALITREQMATMMTRALTKAGINTTKPEKISKFADDAEFSAWAYDAIYYMNSIDIIKGVGDNKFDSKGNATIEQALLISVRSVNKLFK